MLACRYWLGFAHQCFSWNRGHFICCNMEGTLGNTMGSGRCWWFLSSSVFVCMPLLSRLPVLIFPLLSLFTLPTKVTYCHCLHTFLSAERVKSLWHLRSSSCINLLVMIMHSAFEGETLKWEFTYENTEVGFVHIWPFLQDSMRC